MNSIYLLGNIGLNPELRSTPGGTSVTKFSLATSDYFKDKSGQNQTKTEWHQIVVFGKLAELCKEYLTKGSKVLVVGKLTHRQYKDKNEVTKYVTEVIAQNVQFLDSKKETKQTVLENPDFDAQTMSDEDIPF